eukprot:702654-Pleurochrysis_carterae.AAC.2
MERVVRVGRLADATCTHCSRVPFSRVHDATAGWSRRERVRNVGQLVSGFSVARGMRCSRF